MAVVRLTDMHSSLVWVIRFSRPPDMSHPSPMQMFDVKPAAAFTLMAVIALTGGTSLVARVQQAEGAAFRARFSQALKSPPRVWKIAEPRPLTPEDIMPLFAYYVPEDAPESFSVIWLVGQEQEGFSEIYRYAKSGSWLKSEKELQTEYLNTDSSTQLTLKNDGPLSLAILQRSPISSILSSQQNNGNIIPTSLGKCKQHTFVENYYADRLFYHTVCVGNNKIVLNQTSTEDRINVDQAGMALLTYDTPHFNPTAALRVLIGESCAARSISAFRLRGSSAADYTIRMKSTAKDEQDIIIRKISGCLSTERGGDISIQCPPHLNLETSIDDELVTRIARFSL